MPSPNVMYASRGSARAWRRKNVLHRVRDYRQELAYATFKTLGIPALLSELRIKVMRSNGMVEDLGVVGRRVVTNVGVQFFANAVVASNNMTTLNFHASGTGVTAAAVGDTVMQTDSGVARVTGTLSSPANGAFRSVGTMAYASALAITEYGLFSAVTVGTLIDRFVFAAINVVNGDSIQFTFTLTWSAGG